MAWCLHFLSALRQYDPERVFYYNYWIYVWTGFWKYESANRWKAKLYKCYQNSVILMYVVSMALFVIDAVLVRNDLYLLSLNMSSSVLVFMKVSQITLLSRLKKEVVDVHDKLDNHLYLDTVGRTEDDRKIFRKNARYTLRITFTFYSLLAVGLTLRVIADTTLDTKNYLVPMPFREKFDPYYPYVYTQQVLACVHFMGTTLAFDLMEFTLMLRYIAHYEVLENNILKINALYPRTKFEQYVRGYVEGKESGEQTCPVPPGEAKDGEGVPKERTRLSVVKYSVKKRAVEEKVFGLLIQNLKHHQKLLEEIKNFSEIYSRSLLIQLAGLLLISGIVTLQLIFLSNELLSPLFMQQMLYALTAFLHIIYVSTFGSELTSKSHSTANALYGIPWYDMSINNRKIVRLILQRLMQATKLKGGRMINVDRPMCLKFFQFSYNMVALLKKKI